MAHDSPDEFTYNALYIMQKHLSYSLTWTGADLTISPHLQRTHLVIGATAECLQYLLCSSLKTKKMYDAVER